MDPKTLYEKQFGEGKLVDVVSFPFLRRIFKRFDLNREDVAISLLSNTEGKFLDIGCGDGSLIFKVREKFNEVYGIDISPSRIQKAQKILVLKDGQIVEKGNHVELMNLDGYYKKGIQEQEIYEKY